MNTNDILNSLIGHVWDTTGLKSNAKATNWSYPYDGQCVSLIKAYFKILYGKPLAFGNAIDYYTNMKTNGILNYCDWITSNPKNGDIAVMNCWIYDAESGKWINYGHVMIYYNGQYISQNVDMGYGPNPKATLYPNYWAGQIIGWFRPKAIKQAQSGWDATAIVKVGSTVKSEHLSFNMLSSDKKKALIPALDAWIPLDYISDVDGDGYLSSTAELVYLDPSKVEEVDVKKNKVKVHGIWVNAGPLLVKKG